MRLYVRIMMNIITALNQSCQRKIQPFLDDEKLGREYFILHLHAQVPFSSPLNNQDVG